jgi:DNA-binding response OmpR family regulator
MTQHNVGQRTQLVVLVVDDDQDIRFLARRALEAAGYEVREAASAAEAERQIEQATPHLVLLDLMLPGRSGAGLLEGWRRDQLELPVIMLTAFGDAEREAALLEAGADDYLDKPFEARVLTARVNNALRRAGLSATPDAALEAGPVKLLVRERLAMVGERRVILTRTETALLRELLQTPGVVRTYDDLMLRVWGPSYVGQNEILQTNIYRLRQKLEDDPAHPRYLVATPRVGYCLALG